MKSSFYTVAAVAFVLLLISSSCARLVVGSIKKNTSLEYVVPTAAMNADSKFSGISEFIKETEGDANLLLVHGLTSKTTDHFDFLVQRLAYKLNLRLVKSKDTIALKQQSRFSYNKRIVGFGKCKLYQWKFETRGDTKKNVNVYFIFWEPVFKPFKDFMMSYDSTRYRTGLSTMAKDSVFVNVLSDLALYLNTRCKVQIHDAFLQCLEKIDGKTAVIGGGFGVQVLFDAMQLELEHRQEGEKGKEATVASTQATNKSLDAAAYMNFKDSTSIGKLASEGRFQFRKPYDIAKVFLIGNQLPFTSLLTFTPEDKSSANSLDQNVFNGFYRFIDQKKRLGDKDYSLTVVSFYDPNDPFGYRLPKSEGSLRVINVRINIVEYWQIDPRKTTDFVVPKLKNEKAVEALLNIIDQRDSTQNLMLNLQGPANQARNDYRVMGAIADGASYPFVCIKEKEPEVSRPRELHPHTKKLLSGLEADFAKAIIDNFSKRLDIKNSVLPFALPSQFRDSPARPSLTFAGMEESVRHNKLTQLITVHGVKNQEPDHFDMMTKEIAKALGFYETPSSFRVACSGKVGCPTSVDANYGPGTVKISTFEHVTGQTLIIYNVYWSGITRPAKLWLDSASVYHDTSIIPKLVKDVLVTDGLGDIELVFGKESANVMDVIDTAFIAMQKDFERSASKAPVPNSYYMTGSLGTRLLLDYLNKNMTKSHTKKVQDRTKTWFMLTNQLIITALRSVLLKKGQSTYDSYYQQCYGPVNSPMLKILNQEQSDFEVVAFNDPNDIMSFIVPDDVMGVTRGHRIHNVYVNIAQGVEVNMNGLINIAWHADKRLQRLHRKKYRTMLTDFTDSLFRICSVSQSSDVSAAAAREARELMEIAGKRFRHWFVDLHLSTHKREKLNTSINELLADTKLNVSKLERKLKRKKRWYTTNLYLTSDKVEKMSTRYDSTFAAEKLSVAKVNRKGKFMISKAALRKLAKPGIIMPFLRDVSNYRRYQDFVSDFGRAHVGSRTNKKIIGMMAHGFKSVTKTDVDQELYRYVHNRNEKK